MTPEIREKNSQHMNLMVTPTMEKEINKRVTKKLKKPDVLRIILELGLPEFDKWIAKQK